MNKNISEIINAAIEKELPDLVFKNAKIIDVFSLEVIDGDIAVLGDMIIGIGKYHNAKKVIDLKGKFVSPGLIEAHVHIESSLIIPENFSTVLLKHGITTAVIDPHEIANVCGECAVEKCEGQIQRLGIRNNNAETAAWTYKIAVDSFKDYFGKKDADQ